jgi:hypothetical protein
LRTDLQTAYAHERELREQNDTIIASQRKLLTFIVNTDTVRSYWNRVEGLAHDAQLVGILSSTLADTNFSALRSQLNTLPSNADLASVREQFVANAPRQSLQEWIDTRLAASEADKVFAWFVQGPQGIQLARAPFDARSVGHGYAWRAYFHGGSDDLEHHAVGANRPDQLRLQQTRLSTPILTESTNEWVVAVTTPVVQDEQFLGVLGVFLYIQRPPAD